MERRASITWRLGCKTRSIWFTQSSHWKNDRNLNKNMEWDVWIIWETNELFCFKSHQNVQKNVGGVITILYTFLLTFSFYFLHLKRKHFFPPFTSTFYSNKIGPSQPKFYTFQSNALFIEIKYFLLFNNNY